MTTPRPCPFCGGSPAACDLGFSGCNVQCLKCDGRGPTMHDKAAAISAWNGPAPTAEEIDRVAVGMLNASRARGGFAPCQLADMRPEDADEWRADAAAAIAAMRSP